MRSSGTELEDERCVWCTASASSRDERSSDCADQARVARLLANVVTCA